MVKVISVLSSLRKIRIALWGSLTGLFGLSAIHCARNWAQWGPNVPFYLIDLPGYRAFPLGTMVYCTYAFSLLFIMFTFVTIYDFLGYLSREIALSRA